MLRRIASEILSKYAKKDDIVLDPFCGSGTVMMKCREKGIASIGVDINPLATLISTVKVDSNISIGELERKTRELRQRIKKTKTNLLIIDFDGVNYWFEPSAKRNLRRILTCITRIRDPQLRNFYLVTFSSIIRNASNADPHIPPPVYSKRMKKVVKHRKLRVLNLWDARVARNTSLLKDLQGSYASDSYSGAVTGDASNLPIPDKSIDVVITSPPYLDAQKYIRTFKLEIQWLSLLDKAGLDVTERETIGTERVPSSYKIDKEDRSVRAYYKAIVANDPSGWRARVFAKYVAEMREALREVSRTLRPGGTFGLVIGDNEVAGVRVPMHQIMSKLLSNLGFELLEARIDTIKYRGFMLRRNRTAGIIDAEWILVFRKGGNLKASVVRGGNSSESANVDTFGRIKYQTRIDLLPNITASPRVVHPEATG